MSKKKNKPEKIKVLYNAFTIKDLDQISSLIGYIGKFNHPLIQTLSDNLALKKQLKVEVTMEVTEYVG